MKEIPKFYRTDIKPGHPLVFWETDEEPVIGDQEPDDSFSDARNIGETIQTYLLEIRRLLNGRLAHLKPFIPVYLSQNCPTFVLCCPDGVLVRFDKDIEQGEKRSITVGKTETSILRTANQFSEQVIFLHEDDAYEPNPEKGITLTLTKTDGVTGQTTPILNSRFKFDLVLERPEEPFTRPQKPFCLISAQNALDIELLGITLPPGSKSPKDLTGNEKHFIIHNQIRLPVGWEGIQIFPFYEAEDWNPEYAPLWAERDLLAEAMAYGLREKELKTLDPYTDARRSFEQLLKSFADLLDSEPEREEQLQSFLKENPKLLSPSFTQFWPKLRIGKHVTDFVFREAMGDYVLVEIERSNCLLFKRDGHMTSNLNHALEQVSDWRRYIEDNLLTVQNELGLSQISTNPKGMVVMGRSKTLTPENRRKITTLENERPKTKILTYDDVLENAKTVVENMLGPVSLDSGNSRFYYF